VSPNGAGAPPLQTGASGLALPQPRIRCDEVVCHLCGHFNLQLLVRAGVRLSVSDVLERSKVGGGVVWPDSKEDEVAWVSWLWEARLSSTLEPE
jgi:hypothetical protein